ncbi:MAG: YihY/virulence factor BrkB family protein [Pseudomonadota bacterium]
MKERLRETGAALKQGAETLKKKAESLRLKAEAARWRAQRIGSAVSRIWFVQLISVAWRRFGEDNSFALAGYLAYTGLLSFFPFMVLLVVSGSFLVGETESALIVRQMFSVTPEQVRETLQPILFAIIESKTGFLAVVAAMVGLWAGSNAFEATRIGFNLAYDVKDDRHFLRRRVQSLQLAALAACVFVALAFLIVLWPLISGLIAAQGDTSLGFDLFYFMRYGIGLPMFVFLLMNLHLSLPRGRRQGVFLLVRTEAGEDWRISVLPGVIASTILWFIGATAFSMYLRYAPSFAGNYGAMAGVVITLLFFYMSAVILFLGAQINIAREELRRKRSVKGEEMPEGEDYQETTSVKDILKIPR